MLFHQDDKFHKYKYDLTFGVIPEYKYNYKTIIYFSWTLFLLDASWAAPHAFILILFCTYYISNRIQTQINI